MLPRAVREVVSVAAALDWMPPEPFHRPLLKPVPSSARDYAQAGAGDDQVVGVQIPGFRLGTAKHRAAWCPEKWRGCW